ncbi:MAG: hypothetical protein Kow0069_03990 [Promethearchaeota archaeon]
MRIALDAAGGTLLVLSASRAASCVKIVRKFGGKRSRTWFANIALLLAFCVAYAYDASVAVLMPGQLSNPSVPFVYLFGGVFCLVTTTTARKELMVLAGALSREKSLLDRVVADSTFKSEFLKNWSHELRTPLNAIIGFSEVLKELFGGSGAAFDPAEANELLDEVLGAGRRMLRMGATWSKTSGGNFKRGACACGWRVTRS